MYRGDWITLVLSLSKDELVVRHAHHERGGTRRGRGFLTIVAVAMSGALTAQQPSSSSPSDRLVRVDVSVTDSRGRPVDDLQASEFELREEGVPKAIDAVQFVPESASRNDEPAAIHSAEDERAAAVRDDARLFAVFLDEYHVTKGAGTDRARDALLRFVDRDLTSRDLIVVMKPLDSIFAIRLTADREEVRRSIQSFDGRKGEYEPRNAYERNFIAGTPERIEAVRNQVAWSAINAMTVHVGGLAGIRKTLIVVSESIGGADRRRGLEYMATRETVLRSANRANVAIYPLDPREAAAANADIDPLRMMAAETDGAIIAGDLDAGLHRAAEDASRYYLLTYRSARPDDGRFHEVQVRATRPGVRTRARRGFVAASPDDLLRATLLAHANDPKPAAPVEPAPHVSPLIRPWFGVSRGSTGKSRVTFVWEPAARVPGDRGVAKNPARLMVTARTADGTVLFDGPVAATGPGAVEEPGAAAARAIFDMPPGRLRLRMSIEDLTSRVLDVDVRDIAIRELKGDVAIGTPEVLRARNAREFRVIETGSGVPVSSREFSRTERLLIRFPAYAPDGVQPAVVARLLSRTGQPMRDLPVNAAAGDAGARAIDLPLAGLAAGDYIVEVEATSAAGDAKDRVAFRVTP